MLTTRNVDMHVHTNYSVDSVSTMDDYCQYALHNDIKVICFTDHVDSNKRDYGYNFYRPDAFFEEFRQKKEQYAGRIELLAGLEFAEPQEYPEIFAEYAAMSYDFILGSQHFINGYFTDALLEQGLAAEEIFSAYWDGMEAMVEHGGFDILSHLDFPKRYIPGNQVLFDKEQVARILQKAIGKGIGIEINTSGLRTAGNFTMPGREIIDIYVAAGGRRMTAGSDAHHFSDLARPNGEAMEIVPDEIEFGIFRAHKFIPLNEV